MKLRGSGRSKLDLRVVSLVEEEKERGAASKLSKSDVSFVPEE